MNGGSSIGEWHAAQAGLGGEPLELGPQAILPPEAPRVTPLDRALPLVAAAMVLGWVFVALWLARESLLLMAAPALIGFVAAVAALPTLLGIGWMLLRRSGRAEARGFADIAAMMRAEAESLERTIATLAAAIDVNRIKLADQTEALATIGERSVERLSHLGRGFAAEIAQADAHAATLAAATGEAHASLGGLLASLPRARAETIEAADLLDRIARNAGDHTLSLDAQLAGLAEQGIVAQRIADGAAMRLAEHVALMDADGRAAVARLQEATDAMAAAIDATVVRTAAAMDDAGRTLAAQGEAVTATVAAHRATLDGAARDSADALAARIEVIELVVERIARRLDDQRIAGDQMVGELEGGIGRVGERLDRLHAQGVERSQFLAASISALGGSADAMTEALRAGDAMAGRAIGTAETLLTALDAAAREIDETLPDALERLDDRVAASQRIVARSKPELLALVTAAESTHDAIEAIAQVVAGQRGTLDQLSGSLLDTLATGRTRAEALGASVDETVARANRFADEAAPRLVEALLRVRETATVAADKARETLAGVIPEAASRLEAASAAAMARAAGQAVDRQIAAIAGASEAAVAAATQASARLGERLRAIDDATALVETRLEDGRAAREESERDSFARRVSLLIEAMNSASIDIAKSFAPDVADSAWAAYLKGDRGVFTRRAVRLLDAADAREIARLYDGQAVFRDQVNRYIHDFEGMLRAILSQRDGSPLGVTLLSSDMGKLYVALAQAIERLR